MKVSIAQINYTTADFDGNFSKIEAAIKKSSQHSDIIVFSELSITGYYPFDLIYNKDFIKKHDVILKKIINLTKELNTAIIIGVIIKKSNDTFYNSALFINQGIIINNYNKQFLPNYNVFNEERHFTKGKCLSIPFIFNNQKCAVLICEDIWQDDITNLIESKSIDFIFVLNASPSHVNKTNLRLEKVVKLSKYHKSNVIYVNQVGVQDEIVYDGSSFIIDKAQNCIHKSKSFSHDLTICDFNNIQIIDFYNFEYYSFLLSQLSFGLKDFLNKINIKKVVIGCSGGIDSAVVISIAVHALGSENVTAITMPSIYSSKGSVTDSEQLCDNLNIKLFNREIITDYKNSCKQFEISFFDTPSKLTMENIQARIRGRILMEYSNHYNSIVLCTGNKCEMAMGYATLYGDMNGAVNILGDLYKNEVYGLAKYINILNNKTIIPQDIITKEPSAELSENQKDSDSLPSYKLLDAFLKDYIEHDYLSKNEILKLNEIHGCLSKTEKLNIIKTLENSEFKRKQAPLILKVSSQSFGVGRIIPIIKK